MFVLPLFLVAHSAKMLFSRHELAPIRKLNYIAMVYARCQEMNRRKPLAGLAAILYSKTHGFMELGRYVLLPETVRVIPYSECGDKMFSSCLEGVQ
jgi:hypothetical protein